MSEGRVQQTDTERDTKRGTERDTKRDTERDIGSPTEGRLRSGTGAGGRQRHFGDLTGTTGPGTKIGIAAGGDRGVDVTTQPFRVAEAWLGALHDRDLDGATSLYLPHAVLRAGANELAGHDAIRSALEQLPFGEVDQDSARLRGIDRYVRVDFTAGSLDPDGDPRHVTYLEIEGGSILAQWIDEEPQPSADEANGGRIELVTRGDVPDSARDYAVEKVRHTVEHTGRPLLSARVKLTKEGNPAFDRPASAQATLNFDHLTIRAHGSAETFTEAVDTVSAKLDARLEHRSDRKRHRPAGREAVPGTWRHGNLARREKPYFERPVAEREIVRHKSFAPGEVTVDEAAWDMALLDYDFFLFVEIETGEDALLELTPDGQLRLHMLGGSFPDAGAEVNQVQRATVPVPELTVRQAIDLLNAGGDNVLFFANRSTDRGNVVYRRLDGHHGLITPFDEPS